MKPLLIVIVAMAGPAYAAVDGSDSVNIWQGTSLSVTSNVDSALVVIDGRPAGQTPVRIDSVSAGLHYLKILHPYLANWLEYPIRDTLLIAGQKALTLQYNFSPRLLLSSEPFGADVLLGDSLIGTTPLVIQAPDGRGKFRLRKEGYSDADIDRLSGGLIQMHMEWQPENTEVNHGSDPLRLYLTGGATILSGAAAAYFKIKADSRYQMYAQSRDPSLHDQTRRLDTAAAVFLTLAEITLGLFSYFMLSD